MRTLSSLLLLFSFLVAGCAVSPDDDEAPVLMVKAPEHDAPPAEASLSWNNAIQTGPTWVASSISYTTGPNTSEENPVQWWSSFHSECAPWSDHHLPSGFLELNWQTAAQDEPTISYIFLEGTLAPPRAAQNVDGHRFHTYDYYYKVFEDSTSHYWRNVTEARDVWPNETRTMVTIFLCEKPVASDLFVEFEGPVAQTNVSFRQVLGTNLELMDSEYYQYSVAGVYASQARQTWDLSGPHDFVALGAWGGNVEGNGVMIHEPRLTVDADGGDRTLDLEDGQAVYLQMAPGRTTLSVPEVAYANGWLQVLAIAVSSEQV